jgi:release factor glutamine methyltransferase
MVILNLVKSMQFSIKQVLKTAINSDGLTRLDAHVLLCHILKVAKEYLIMHDDEILTSSQVLSYQDLCKKRLNGFPIAYILGNKEFYGLDFNVNENVLIPRPDTEVLVEFAINNALQNAYVLDMGTGSGAIAIATKHHRKDIKMYACDISDKALNIAQQNAIKNNVDIEFIHSNWFESIPSSYKFDMIVSNPPYIHVNDEHLNQEIRFEPRLALTDENDGLQHIINIVKNARLFLNKNGYVAIEHGYNQAQNVKDIFIKYGYKNINHLIDLGGNTRVTLGIFTDKL